MSLELECNLKTVKYLVIILDLKTGTYKPSRKPNDETLYIQVKSNHPANILTQLPVSVETRLSNLSSNPENFYEAPKHYQNVLNLSGYDCKIQRRPTNNKAITKETSFGSPRLFQRASPTTLVNIFYC